jgi:hypothetical protein
MAFGNRLINTFVGPVPYVLVIASSVSSGSPIKYSTDGIGFTDVPTPFASNNTGIQVVVGYNGTHFIAMNSACEVVYSTNGINWTRATSTPTRVSTNVVTPYSQPRWTGTRWVMSLNVAGATGQIWYTANSNGDGGWTNSGQVGFGTAIANQTVVAWDLTPPTGGVAVRSLNSGSTWSSITGLSFGNQRAAGVGFSATQFAIMGGYSDNPKYSNDSGANFQNSTGTGGGVHFGAYSDGTYIYTLKESDRKMYRSADGGATYSAAGYTFPSGVTNYNSGFFDGVEHYVNTNSSSIYVSSDGWVNPANVRTLSLGFSGNSANFASTAQPGSVPAI